MRYTDRTSLFRYDLLPLSVARGVPLLVRANPWRGSDSAASLSGTIFRLRSGQVQRSGGLFQSLSYSAQVGLADVAAQSGVRLPGQWSGDASYKQQGRHRSAHRAFHSSLSTHSLSSRILSGPIRQHPPTMLAPARIEALMAVIHGSPKPRHDRVAAS